MRKLLTVLAGAATFIGASSASAATEPPACTLPGQTGCIFKQEINQATLDAANASNFGATLVDVFEPFTISFDFVLDEMMLASSSITTVLSAANDIDFTSVFLDGIAFTQSGFDPADETFFLTLAGPLAAGTHTITVNGQTMTPSGDGAFGANIELSMAAVPEPGTWMLMLLGFGAVGVTVRKSRKPALLQVA